VPLSPPMHVIIKAATNFTKTAVHLVAALLLLRSWSMISRIVHDLNAPMMTRRTPCATNWAVFVRKFRGVLLKGQFLEFANGLDLQDMILYSMKTSTLPLTVLFQEREDCVRHKPAGAISNKIVPSAPFYSKSANLAWNSGTNSTLYTPSSPYRAATSVLVASWSC
jgi:hypothetical protein